MILERRREGERRTLRREQSLLRTQLHFLLSGAGQPKLAAEALTIDMVDPRDDAGKPPPKPEPRRGSFEQLMRVFGSDDRGFRL